MLYHEHILEVLVPNVKALWKSSIDANCMYKNMYGLFCIEKVVWTMIFGYPRYVLIASKVGHKSWERCQGWRDLRPLPSSWLGMLLQGSKRWDGLRAALHLEAVPIRCVRGLKSSLVIGQKAQISPNPFTPRGWADLVVWFFWLKNVCYDTARACWIGCTQNEGPIFGLEANVIFH
jgi:hypothetical protein